MTMQALFQHAKTAVHTTKAKVAAGSVLAVGMIGSPHAQTTGAEAAFSEIQSEGTAMIGYAWPVLATITAAFVGMKIFKRLASRV